MKFALWTCVVCLCSIVKDAYGRAEPARVELCRRYPTLPACQRSASADGVQEFCARNEQMYKSLCAQPEKSEREEIRQFCEMCKLQFSNSQQLAHTATSSQASQEEVAAACRKYEQMASRHCTGNEAEPIRRACDAYRRFCKAAAVPSTIDQQVQTAPLYDAYCSKNSEAFSAYCSETSAADAVFFCRTYASKCTSASIGDSELIVGRQKPSSALFAESSITPDVDVSLLCNQYRVIAEKLCAGYEPINMREYCNLYRVYCQHKRPFPIIDGNIGVTRDAWGVSGIPFYPFNPQGAIGGGKRTGVGFGDWGARVTTQQGVSDFWDQGKVTNANWQRGIYGPARGWGVPLVGIGGFRSNIVKLSGIAAPSDYAAIFSGGVPPPALPAGAKGIPIPGLSEAQPSPLGSTVISPVSSGIAPQTSALRPADGSGLPDAVGHAIVPNVGLVPTQPSQSSPFNIGQTRGVGLAGLPLFQQSSGASINPLEGVSTGKGWNAGPISGISGSSVNFGGIPFLG